MKCWATDERDASTIISLVIGEARLQAQECIRVLKSNWDDFAHYNFEEILRMFLGLDLHGSQLYVEQWRIYPKSRGGYESSCVDISIDRNSTVADFNLTLKMRH